MRETIDAEAFADGDADLRSEREAMLGRQTFEPLSDFGLFQDDETFREARS